MSSSSSSTASPGAATAAAAAPAADAAAAAGEEEVHVLGAELLSACSRGLDSEVERLLKKGVPVYYTDPSSGRTPLMCACESGHGSIVSLLIQGGAPWNALDSKSKSAGDYAMDNGHERIVEFMMDHAVTAELLLTAVQANNNQRADNMQYLKNHVRYDNDKLLDEQGRGVMMEWERSLMKEHAQVVCGNEDELKELGRARDVLNVGFGMGIIDGFIQELKPRSHTIIEAHPDVYAKMKRDGWTTKPGVTVVFGRWQDHIADLGPFDGVFYDTFGEGYDDQRDFQSYLPKLMRAGGVYSYFNGINPSSFFFHSVASEIVKLEMAQLGFSTEFVETEVHGVSEETWKDVAFNYWNWKNYFLPICRQVTLHDDDDRNDDDRDDEHGEEAAAADGDGDQDDSHHRDKKARSTAS